MGNRVSTVSDLLTVRIGGERTAEAHKKPKSARATNNRIKSTKYTIFTFLPQNLLEQFRRIANFYFLVMVIISASIESPVSPFTSLAPLVFVITVTAAKQGYEDFLRYRADNIVNYSMVTVIRDGKQLDVRSQDVMQGDLVKAARDCDVPCDLVLLLSSDAAGKVFVTTANLDGETNLKTLSVPKGLPDGVGMDTLHQLGTIECEQPRTDLYVFNGRIELSTQAQRRQQYYRLSAISQARPTSATLLHEAAANADDVDQLSAPLPAIPLQAENLLMRGSRIKNTEWAIGCAVYTGQNTKLSLNSRLTRNKMSSSEAFVNKFLVFFLVLLITMVVVSHFVKTYFDREPAEHNIYLGDPPARNAVRGFLQDFFSFLILFNYLIPISLYVTIEFHKFIGAFFMEWDPALYDADTNQPFLVNTSDLNEELGQVKYLFSDKTGTLTKNEMILQQCSIRGRMYKMTGSGIQETNHINAMKIGEFREEHMTFFMTLATCHTVQVACAIDDEDIVPAAQSSSSADAGMSGKSAADDDGADSDAMNAILDHTHLVPRESPYHAASRESLFVVRNLSAEQIGNIAEENGGAPVPPPPSRSDTDDQLTTVASSSRTIVRPDIMMDDEAFIRSRVQLLMPNAFATMDNNNASVDNSNVVGSPRLGRQPSPLSPALAVRSRMKLQRPMSTIYGSAEKESTDSIKQQTHRRTQSYVPATTHSRQTQFANADARRNSKSNSLTRFVSFASGTMSASGSVANLREYYAAPAFNPSTLLARKESILRRNVIRTAVQKLDYQASSPDEKALVEACAQVGILFTGEVADTLTVRLQPFRSAYTIQSATKTNNNNNNNREAKGTNNNTDTEVKFDRLHTIEFTSDRKRMSTVLRDRRTGQLWLVTKGAESHVLPLCPIVNASDAQLMSATQRHIDEFARNGLRTLAIARRPLSEEEYEQYRANLMAAGNSLADDRRQQMQAVDAQMEKKLQLLGATAVEDALQDDVRDTLESLRAAGIKVWVLTGDKVETALNIALSCGHIPENAERYFIVDCTEVEQLTRHLDILEYAMNLQPRQEFALLIDGASLAVALASASDRFRVVSMLCRSVLCCRLSPLQKCEIVQLIRQAPGRPITGAIGDGANDVSMIQAAHVGLGIVGKEGRQAARCADYAFANFSMLKRVLLVHGHYYSHRLSELVLYFFYKNLVFMLIQFYFQTSSMFSTESVYDSLYLTLYNVFYTSVPVLVLSLTEKVHTEERLMHEPPLYMENAGNRRFYWKHFIGWMALGIYHSAVIYGTAFLIWTTNAAILPEAYTVNFYCFGTFLMHNVVVVVNLKLWLIAKYQSNWFIVSVIGSILFFVVSTLVYNVFLPNLDGDMTWVYNMLLGAPTVWLLFLYIAVTTLLVDFTMKACREAIGLRINSIWPGDRLAYEVDGSPTKRRKLFSYRGSLAAGRRPPQERIFEESTDL